MPLPKQIRQTVRDISALKIQGATNIAVSALKALDTLSNMTFPSRERFESVLAETVLALSSSRATEPAMRNSLRAVSNLPKGDLKTAQRALHKNITSLLTQQKKNKQETAKHLASLIENGDTIFTHCHSSTVTAGLKLAKKQGRRFAVVCTETRPRYQGRTTAKELDAARIPVTLVVDSAASLFVEQSTKVFVGCDSIEWGGSVLNKIGTFSIALLARHFGVPFYSVTESYKFSPGTRSAPETIEYRSPKEIWDEDIHTLNPAFDRTPARLLTSIVTELGVLPPRELVKRLRKIYA